MKNTNSVTIFLDYLDIRIEYIFQHLISNILGFEVNFTIDEYYFQSINNIKISYTKNIFFQQFSILKSDFFDDNSLEHYYNQIKKEEFYKDKVAISFALITRLEEYFPFSEDSFGRFSFQESIIFKKIPIKIPYLEQFAYELFIELKKQNPDIQIKNKPTIIQPTFDLDHPFLISHLPIKRQLKSILASIIKLKPTNFKDKVLAIINPKKDPYNIYQKLEKIPNKKVFLPVGRYSQIDSFHDFEQENYLKFIKELSTEIELGIHPSYQSNFNNKELDDEINKFSNYIGHLPIDSRQHYLYLKFPQTYNNLIKSNIFNDFSMGFQDQIGFRAGTATPFYWFNIIENKVTKLKIHPFCWMDVTLKNYLKLSPSDAKIEVEKLKYQCIKYQGLYSFILHNESFSNYGPWKEWYFLKNI